MQPELASAIAEKGALASALRAEIGKAVIGQKDLVDKLLVGLFVKGHVLIEGVPGLAKTTAVKGLAAAIHGSFKRIQFTPDLLPSDLVGTEIYEAGTGVFRIKQGPVFHNVVLADEINRAPSKVQSALLEAMQERQVTVGGETFALPDPFLVLATQNPIEQEGTYPLPEAQVDRFLLKLTIGYPTKDEERDIVTQSGLGFQTPSPVLGPEQLAEIHALVKAVHLDPRILDYILDLVAATRDPKNCGAPELAGMLEFGASPRASIALALCARAVAFLDGRAYVTPRDVKVIGADVLRHRIILSYEAEAEDVSPDAVVGHLFETLPVP